MYIACTDANSNEDTASTNEDIDYTVDTSAPSDIATVYDGDSVGVDIDTTASGSQLSANWTSATDTQSGISDYQYAIGTSIGGTDIVDWTSNGALTYVTKTGLSLTNGQMYYVSVRAENGAGMLSNVTTSDGQSADFTDSTPPSDVATVYDGDTVSVDITWTGSSTQLSANWTDSADAESGVARYWYAIGTTAGGNDVVDWTDNSAVTSVTSTGLTLTNGQAYYFTVKAENGVGLQSGTTSSNGQTLDNTAPADVTYVYDGTGADETYIYSYTQISGNYSASSDAESGVAKYWYAIGTTEGGTDVVDWTDNGTNLSFTKTGLSLTDGQTYYISVRAENNAGLTSGIVSSNGATVDLSTPVQSAWNPSDGASLSTTSPSVTFSTDENASCRWSLSDLSYDGMSGNDCSGTGTTSHICSVTGLSEGANMVYTACSDVAGNEDSASTNTELSYTVDTMEPVQSNWLPASGSYLSDTSETIALNTDENATCRWSLTDSAYSSMAPANTCSGGGATGHSCSVTGMSTGAEAVYVACADALGNENSETTNKDLSYIIDNTAPADVASVSDGTGADIDTTTSGTELSANWTASSDAESGVAKYWYAIGTTSGGTDVVDWTDNGTNTSVTKSGLALSDGVTYYVSVKAENGAGLESNAVSSDGQMVELTDSTPPIDITSVYDGTGADIDMTASTTQLSANWTSSSDPESGVARYWYAIGTTPGGTDIVTWTDNVLSTSMTHTGLSLAQNQDYYISVKAENGMGLESSVTTSDGVTVDATAPSAVTVSDGTGVDVDFITSTTSLSANWTASTDAESGITRYLYAIGTTSGGADVVGWTDNGLATSFTKSGMTLTDGTTYYVSVKSENGVNLESDVATSDGQKLDLSTPVQSAWNPAKGATVTSAAMTLTLTTDEAAYCRWSLTDDSYSTMPPANQCSGAGTTSQSCAVEGMNEGAEYVYVACADEAGNEDDATTNENIGYTVDTTAPAQSAWDPAKGAFIYTTSPTITLTTDEAAYCRWELNDNDYSAMPGANVCTGGGTTGHTCSVSGLSEGSDFVYISCVDLNANEETASTNEDINYTIDTSAPADVATVYDGGTTGVDIDTVTSGTQLSANWTASSDPQSGIDAYWYAIGTTSGGTDVRDWTTSGTNAYMTATGLALNDGQAYYVSVKAENGAGMMSGVTTSDGQTADFSDTTAPSDIAIVYDGADIGIDMTWAGSASQLSANWSASSDAESGIAAYYFAIGTTAGATDVVDWTGNGANTSVTKTGLVLTNGNTYYFTVKAQNGVGLESGTTSSNGQTIDTTIPADVSYLYDGTGSDVDVITNSSQISANWGASSDAESGIAAYYYAIGTTAGGTDVVAWTNNGTNTSVTETGLGLTEGQTYYVSVRAENGAGLTSGTVTSDGATLDTSPPVQSNWSPADSSVIGTTNPTVTFDTDENATCKFAGADADYGSIAPGNICGGSGTTSQSCSVTSLSEGANIVYLNCIDENNNADTSITNTELTYTVDTGDPIQSNWSPAAGSYLSDTSVTITLNTNEASTCRWSLTDYGYSSMPVENTCSGAASTNHSCSVTGMSTGAEYVYIACEDIQGNGNTTSTNKDLGYTVDDTAPADVATVNDGTGSDIDTTTSGVQLSANWTASSDAESGIVRYLYAIGTSAGGTDVVDWTDNGTNTSVTHTGLALADGTTYYFSVRAENGAGLLSNVVSSDGQQVNLSDSTPPSDIADVYDGTGSDIDVTGSTTQLSANWTGSSDPESGIAKYWYAIGTTAGATDVVSWTNNGTNTSVTKTGLSLSHGQQYFFTVKAENGMGLESGATNSDGATVDSTPPSTVTVSDGIGSDIDYVASTTDLSANWTSSSDSESGISRYYYAVGTSAGGTDVVDWTNNALVTTVSVSGLTLIPGQTYYVSVKAENGVGVESTVATSDGQTVDVSPPSQSGWSPAKGSYLTSTSQTITFTTSENATCRWSLSDDSYSSMSAGNECTGGGTTSQSCAVTGMSEGAEYVYISCTDTAGNEDSAATNEDINYTIDASPPVQSAWNPDKGDYIYTTSPSITLTTDEEAYCRWSLTDQSYTDMSSGNACAGGGTTSQSCAVSGMSEGSDYVYISCADLLGNEDTIATNDDINYFIDASAPTDIATVYDGGTIGVDSNVISSGTEISANWTASTDPQSGIARYWYAIGTTAGGTDTADWTDNGTETSVTRTGLALTDGVTYYVSVKAENGAGMMSNITTSYGATADFNDTTPPSDIATVYDGSGTGVDASWAGSTSQLSANWTASSDTESGIAKYWYAVGTTAGGTDVVDWTDNGAVTYVTRTGLGLTNGDTYYFTVKAQNGAGLQSGATNSDGQTIDTTAPATITSVNDGTGADVDTTGDSTQLSANWTASSDTESGVAKYWYAVGTTAGGTDVVDWTDNSATTSVTITGLTLTDGQTYYFSVKAENNAGLVADVANSDGQLVDVSAPVQSNWSPSAGTTLTTTSPTITLNTDENATCRWSLADEAYGDMDIAGACAGGGGTSHTCSVSGLTGTSDVVYIACTDTIGNTHSASTNTELSYTIDVDPPVQSNWDPAKGSGLTSTSVEITFDTDENSSCKWSLSDQAYGDMPAQNTCSGTGVTFHTCSADSLAEGSEVVYIACSDTGGSADTADTNEDVDYTVDTSAPSAITTVNDGAGADIDTTQSLVQLTANWTDSTDAESGITRYWYAVGTTAGGTDIVGWTDNGTDTSVTKTGLSLTEGSTYFFSVKAENGVGLMSTPANSDGQQVTGGDSTNPTDIATVNDGAGADIDYSSSLTQLTANWTASTDTESGIARYWYAIGTTAGGADIVGWTDNSTNTSVTKTGLSLTGGQAYYFSVKAENGAGLQSNVTTSDGQTIDATAPSTIASVNDGTGADVDTTTSQTQLSANWTASTDAESGIVKYSYAVGTTAGGTDIVSWTDNATATTVTKSGLSLSVGSTYYFTVKAENGAGMESTPANSDGVTVQLGTLDEVTAMTALAGDTEAQLMWTDPEAATSTKIIRKLGGYPSSIVDGTEVYDGAGESFLDTGLTNGYTYYYAAFAYDGSVYSTADSDGARTTVTPTASGLIINKGWSLVGVSQQNAYISPATVFGVNVYEIVKQTGGTFEFLTSETKVDMDFAEGLWIYSESDIGAVSAHGTDYSGNSYQITLQQGWNVISDPFNESIFWGDSKVSLDCSGQSKTLVPIYYYSDTLGYRKLEANDSAYIIPWYGYWIDVADTGCVLTITK